MTLSPQKFRLLSLAARRGKGIPDKNINGVQWTRCVELVELGLLRCIEETDPNNMPCHFWRITEKGNGLLRS